MSFYSAPPSIPLSPLLPFYDASEHPSIFFIFLFFFSIFLEKNEENHHSSLHIQTYIAASSLYRSSIHLPSFLTLVHPSTFLFSSNHFFCLLSQHPSVFIPSSLHLHRNMETNTSHLHLLSLLSVLTLTHNSYFTLHHCN